MCWLKTIWPRWQDKIDKEVEKAAKRFGETFDKEQFLATNPRVLEYQEKIDSASQRLYGAMERQRPG